MTENRVLEKLSEPLQRQLYEELHKKYNPKPDKAKVDSDIVKFAKKQSETVTKQNQ